MGSRFDQGRTARAFLFTLGQTGTCSVVVLLGNWFVHRSLSPAGLLPGWFALVVAIVAIVLVGRDLPAFGFRVPMRWSKGGPNAYSLLFGTALGLGVLTRVPSPGTYFVFAFGLTAPIPLAIGVILAYSLGRSFPAFLLPAAAADRHVSSALHSYKRLSPVLALTEMGALGWVAAATLGY